MNRRSLPELLADLEDLRGRLKDAQVTQGVLSHLTQAEVALKLVIMRHPEPEWPEERPSYAPRNVETRKTASEHFRQSREYTSEALRRLRRES